MDLANHIACNECDLLHRRQPLPTNGVATCVRCGAALYRSRPNSLDRALAMAISGIILIVIANIYPFITLNLEGRAQETTLITGIAEFYRQGMSIIAILVLVTGIVIPLVQLLGLIYILLPLRFDHRPWRMVTVFRTIRLIQPWGMVEVFMLGILISIVKLADMATVIPGVALYAFLVLIFVVATATRALDPDIVWNRLTLHQ